MEVLLISMPGGCHHGWGMFGAFLRSNPSAAAAHDSFVWVTSAVSGPHLPVYAKVGECLTVLWGSTAALQPADRRRARRSPTLSLFPLSQRRGGYTGPKP
jgi:hypothetical protein